MTHPLHENEIEFFISTNGALSAERSLVITEALLQLVRSPQGVGPSGFVEFVHVGRGSFRARLKILLRDPATQTITALAALALTGIQLLQKGDDQFSREVALACIESHAHRCGFRTAETEFVVERDQMPAFAATQERQKQTGEPIALPPLGYGYITSGGAYLKEGDSFIIDRIPPKDSTISFERTQPTHPSDDSHVESEQTSEINEVVCIYEDEEERIVWMDSSKGTLEVVNHEILSNLDWGGEYLVKAIIMPDENAVEILEAKQMPFAEPNKTKLPEPSLVPWYAATAQKSTRFVGQLRGSRGNYTFKPQNLSEAIVDEILADEPIPTERTIEIEAYLRRGSRGGMADPRLIIVNWSDPESEI